MKFFYSEHQNAHAPAQFLLRGQPSPSPEGPKRAEILVESIKAMGLTIHSPNNLESGRLRERLSRIHSARYLHFLETIHERWRELLGSSGFVAPNVHPCGYGQHYPRHPIGQAGWHLHDMACPIDAHSFRGILASAATAEAAAEAVLDGESCSYGLCRPPGHHAGPERAGGFCFLNNSALAATILREWYSRVAVIDVDVHHGNGTQDIFWTREDVWTGSVHADPNDYYPFFWGRANEVGVENGAGRNLNIPLPVGSDGDSFMAALNKLLKQCERFQPGAVVIALGLDAHKNDPLKGMKLETRDFTSVGEQLGKLSGPVVLIQEGGYPSINLGENLNAFLTGFLSTFQATH